MLALLLLLVGLSATGYLIAIAYQSQIWKYILKPGTMLFIIIIAFLKADEVGTFGWLILLGLIFSVTGDIFLMLPSDRFLLGLISFFIAHVVYVIAFPAEWEITSMDLITALVLFGIAIVYFLLLRSGVHQEGGVSLQIAVILYIAVISLMVFCAIQSEVLLLMAGALFFYVSDAILAWNRFVRKHKWGDFGVMITYYLAQTLFAVRLWYI